MLLTTCMIKRPTKIPLEQKLAEQSMMQDGMALAKAEHGYTQ